MLDTIYETVMPSLLKKLQMIQNISKLMFQAVSIVFYWIFIKQIIVFSTPFLLLVETFFEKMMPGGISIFPLPRF